MKVWEFRREISDLITHAVTALASLLLLGVAAHIILSSAYEGILVIAERGIAFFLEPPGPPGGRLGGIGPILTGTVLIISLATLISCALGIPAGLFMSEYRDSKIARVTHEAVQLIAEVPTVIVGLVVFFLIVVPMKTPSAFAGAVSLSIVALPYVASQVRESVSSIPLMYREAAFSLGLPKWKVVLGVLLPFSARGVATATLLGIMRALGETAPVLFTAGAALHAFYGLDKPSSTLSLLIIYFAVSPYENWRRLAWGSAFILVILSLMLAYIVRKVSSRGGL